MESPDFYINFLKGIYPTDLLMEDISNFFLSSCKSGFSCRKGHLEVAQWLWSISKETIDLHAQDEDAFISSCVNGHLEVVQWLWSISNGTIDIHADDEWVFITSC
jgi:hypothetical protein